MMPAIRVGTTGFGLIAVCYGFARFAFGLFLPQIRADLALSSSLAGVISGGAFLAYCLAIVVSAHLSERIGARAIAVAAALVACAGTLGIATSASPAWLAIFVVLAGASTGLASPPMADAVSHAVAKRHQDATNTVINAGTSAGVALSGPIALIMGDDWRMVFTIFSGIAFALAVAAFISLPTNTAQRRRTRHTNHSRLPSLNANLIRLVGASCLMGISSTALWSFGGEIVTLRLDWAARGAGLLWTMIGTAGVCGAAAGWLTVRLGLNAVHWLFLAVLAASIGMLGLTFTTPTLTLIGGALFGAAYVMLTGIYLVWGTSALPNRPATGLMVGFLTIAVGQTIGAPLFGFLMSRTSLEIAVLAFSGLGLAAGLFWSESPPNQVTTADIGHDPLTECSTHQ
ncbi:MFS transporter [Salinisphaera sp. USBA-960]|nr:MFS transporter [Salifodinibacter halophilus]NNC26908.1 MFS transporter [Salifodinibacter halophilus]